jgi:transposase
MKDSPSPAKCRRYDAAFRAEALHLASQSRSTKAAACALDIDPKRIYKWQKEALTPVAAARGAELDPATVAELRQLRAANRRQAQELKILRKPSLANALAALSRRHRTNEPLPLY